MMAAILAHRRAREGGASSGPVSPAALWIASVAAAAAAVECRGAAGQIAVASGYATQEGHQISGDALRAAEMCCAAGLTGVAVDAGAARQLGVTRARRPRY